MKHMTEIVATLFLSREQAHRAHLRTKSYAKTLYKLRNLA